MKKIFEKGNALLLTTVILFAVSTISAGLAMYFYYANRQTNNSNVYEERHIELENEFNKKYIYALSGEKLIINDREIDLRLSIVEIINNENDSLSFSDGEYRHFIQFVNKDDLNNKKTCSYTLELDVQRKTYILQKNIVVDTSNYTLSVSNVEVYKVNAN